MLLLLTAALAADPEMLAADLGVLCGEQPYDGAPLVSRSIFHPDLYRARRYLEERLGQTPRWSVSKERFEARGQVVTNLIARLPGTDPALSPMIVGAHYDSTASSDEEWEAATDPAPGCDDDASGVAALLDLAAQLEAMTFQRTVVLAFFSAEEVGLLGSTHHVSTVDSVHLMLSLDPIGYNAADQDRLFVVYDSRWPEPATRMEALRPDFEVVPMDRELIGGDDRSDHAPFWEAGHPALHLATFPQPLAYHTMDDRLELVDQDLLARITDTVAAFVIEEAVPVEAAGGCQTAVASTRWISMLWRR